MKRKTSNSTKKRSVKRKVENVSDTEKGSDTPSPVQAEWYELDIVLSTVFSFLGDFMSEYLAALTVCKTWKSYVKRDDMYSLCRILQSPSSKRKCLPRIEFFQTLRAKRHLAFKHKLYDGRNITWISDYEVRKQIARFYGAMDLKIFYSKQELRSGHEQDVAVIRSFDILSNMGKEKQNYIKLFMQLDQEFYLAFGDVRHKLWAYVSKFGYSTLPEHVKRFDQLYFLELPLYVNERVPKDVTDSETYLTIALAKKFPHIWDCIPKGITLNYRTMRYIFKYSSHPNNWDIKSIPAHFKKDKLMSVILAALFPTLLFEYSAEQLSDIEWIREAARIDPSILIKIPGRLYANDQITFENLLLRVAQSNGSIKLQDFMPRFQPLLEKYEAMSEQCVLIDHLSFIYLPENMRMHKKILSIVWGSMMGFSAAIVTAIPRQLWADSSLWVYLMDVDPDISKIVLMPPYIFYDPDVLVKFLRICNFSTPNNIYSREFRTILNNVSVNVATMRGLLLRDLTIQEARYCITVPHDSLFKDPDFVLDVKKRHTSEVTKYRWKPKMLPQFSQSRSNETE